MHVSFHKRCPLSLAIWLGMMTSCEKQQDFATLEEKSVLVKDPEASMLENQEGEVKIISWYPKEELVLVKEEDILSISVQVGVIAGKNVTYGLILNGVPHLQEQTEAFFQFDAAQLKPGENIVEVHAHNSLHSDSHSFKFYKNRVPQVISQAPDVGKGLVISCKDSLVQYKVDVNDEDKDKLTFAWSLNEVLDPDNVIVSNADTQSSAFYKVTCKDVGTHIIAVKIFDGQETVEARWPFQVTNPDDLDGPVEIKSFTPIEDPVVMTDVSKVTFAISVNPKAGSNVIYTWSIDNIEVSSGATPFYMVNGINLTPGLHTLSVRAANSLSEKTKVFNIRKNSKPNITLKSPNQSGNTMFCNGATLNLSVTAVDADNDNMQFSWLVNGAASPSMLTSNTLNGTSTAVLTPTCAIEGTNVITVRISDGLEISSYDWSVTVQQNPADLVGPVEIKSFIPIDNPVVMTNVSKHTFAISVHPKAGANVIYTFTLDGSEILNGSTPFYNVNGSDLSAGTHTLEVTATNLISSASKVFNIRKNSKPVLANTVPGQSGNTVYCDGSTLTLSASASDVDNDTMSFTWLLNGGAGSSAFSVSSTTSNSSVVFTPVCGLIGGNIVTLQVTDGVESSTYDWSVNVQQNPDDLEQPVVIQAFTPTADPVVMTNQSAITFATSVNPQAGIHVNYLFKLDATDRQNSSTPFHILNGSEITAGNHIMTVTASNNISSTNKIFNIRKNSVPTYTATSPAQTGNIVYCGGSTMNLSAMASDIDNDGLSFSWYVNGAAAPSLFAVTNGSHTSAVIFTPVCTLEGTNVVTVKVSDGYEIASYDWSVTVQNPVVVDIAAYTPTGSPVVINSTASQFFTVTATGKPPLSYEWKLDDTVLTGETLATLNLSGAGISAGNHTLVIKASDFNSDESHSFSIVRNAPPVLSAPSPTNASLVRMNVDAVHIFNINGSDANNDTISYTWKIDGNASASLSSSATAGGSQGVLTPSPAMLGNHVITVSASDGRESTTYSWNINVNYFSEQCNNLAAGKICTLVGDATLGDGVLPSLDSNQIKMMPFSVIDDGAGNTFISDLQNVVWFYNRSGASLTRFGIQIPAGAIKIVLGIGAAGTGVSGENSLNFPLNSPRGLAYDAARGYLYVADYSNHRILRINDLGVVHVIAGTGAVTNNAGTNTDNTVGTAHVCANPAGLALNAATDELFATCYTTNAVKRFTAASDALLSNIKGFMLVGALTSGATAAATVDGLTGVTTGYSQARGPWGITLDPRNGNVFFTEYAGCTFRVVNRTGSPESYINGAITAPAGQVKTIAGVSTSCTTAVGALAAVRYSNLTGVSLLLDGPGTSLRGFFLSALDDRIHYLNNEGTSVEFGGQVVATGEDRVVVGTGTAGYNGNGLRGNITAITDPYGLLVSSDKTKIYFSDYGNRRFRYLDISLGAGEVETDAGNGIAINIPYSGDNANGAREVTLNNPTYLKYGNGSLYFSDQGNGRLREVDMTTGEVSRLAGAGIGLPSSDVPQNILTRGVYGLEIVGSTLLFVDNGYVAGANRTCQVRGYNYGESTASVFGTSIANDYVNTIAGLYSSGCVAWSDGVQNNQPAVNVGFHYPEDIASNGTTLYISNYQNHCIMRMDANGILSRVIGDCVNAGSVDNVSIGGNTARLRYPIGVALDPLNYASGNIFIVDQTDQANALIRYANFGASAVTIGGVSIPAGFIRTVFTLPSTPRPSGIAAFENQICIAEGQTTAQTGLHNVICKDRNAAFDTTTLRVGSPPPTTPQGRPTIFNSQEGVPATEATLCGPWGIEFDDVGNLYIPERCGHTIRMVKKWW